jgi:hypothetical protein
MLNQIINLYTYNNSDKRDQKTIKHQTIFKDGSELLKLMMKLLRIPSSETLHCDSEILVD